MICKRMLLRNPLIITTVLFFSSTTTTITTMALSTPAKTTSNRRPAMRSIASTLSDLSSSSSTDLSSASIDERIKLMAERAKNGTPFTEEEIRDITNGLQNLAPVVDSKDTSTGKEIDFTGLQNLIGEVAHLSHKNWSMTSENSDKMCKNLAVESSDTACADFPLTASARQLLERVVKEGNWDGAVESVNRSDRPTDEKSWAVLVTGVNGIRKTTSMYQPWFGDLLSEALTCPPSEMSEIKLPPSMLPTGSNSFFRQLDHMICTLCNEEFTRLYAWSTAQLTKVEGDEEPISSEEVVNQYSNYKVCMLFPSQQ